MGLDNATLFVANIIILLVTVAAYGWVWLRVQTDRHWLYWIASNLTIAAALVVYVTMPDLPPNLAVWPDVVLMVGIGLRLLAARCFDGRRTASLAILAPVACYLAAALLSGSQSLNFGLANVVLAAQATAVAIAFWWGRGDGLPSRYGLVGVYLLMAASFAFRALQGFFASEQISSYIPFDVVLQVHLLIALIHIAAGAVFVLSIAYERNAVALRRAALSDPLTGLANRRAFESRLRTLLATPGERRFAVAVLDIDHFKRINDRHGHAAGDAALKSFAEVCVAAIRPVDELYRIGGEEFAIIIAAVSPAEVHAIVERLRVAVRTRPADCNGEAIRMTVSAGICHASAVPPDFDRLLEAADAQLYAAKADGRDRIGEAPHRSGFRQAAANFG